MNAARAETESHGAWLEPLFDVAFNAPGGIARLRQLILSLAMQGKLVPQLASEAPASELLKQIAAEKAVLVKAGKIRAPKPLEPTKDAENPHVIPTSWEWVRLQDVTALVTDGDHQPPPKAVKGIPFLVIGNLNTGSLNFDGCRFVPKEYFSALDWGRKPSRGDILYTVTGSFGITIPVNSDEAFCVQRHVAIFKSTESTPVKYLAHFLRSVGAEKYAKSIATGIAQKTVPLSGLRGMPIPLPPLKEQERIFARIDQLMSHCDDLERLRQQKADKRAAVRAATLRQWLAGDDAAASLLGEHFATLVSTREDVAELRKAILQLAVMGKLVKQDANDVPALELLKQIEAEKAVLVEAGKIRSPKPLEPIADVERPYAIPAGWEWVRVGTIVDVGTGSTPTTTNSRYYGGSIPWYTSSATNKQIADEPEKFITDLAIKETNCKVFPVGTLIIALYGQGKTRGQISELAQAGATNQAIAALVFFETSTPLRRYLKYFFVKSYEELREQAAGAAQPNLNVGKIKETMIPLPPREEQERIVARIDRLMQLCDTLERNIDAVQAKQIELLEAVMARV